MKLVKPTLEYKKMWLDYFNEYTKEDKKLTPMGYKKEFKYEEWIQNLDKESKGIACGRHWHTFHPVHSQARGRIFLPFADDDPKTAEIMSKILLLAEDHNKDPAILRQLSR